MPRTEGSNGGRGAGLAVLLAAVMGLAACAGPSRLGPTPELTNQKIVQSYRNGEAALKNGDYVKARRVLMQIISRFPGENDLAQVQWLIARSYELEGRTASAISEYKRFLANYPDHPNAQDAEDRIQRLEQVRPKAPSKPRAAVRVDGDLSTDYEYGAERSPAPLTTLNLISTRLNMQVRNLNDGRGKLVFSGLRTFDLEGGRNDRARIQKLYGDWHTKGDSFSVRVGRQPATAGSLSTRYDGAEAHYRPVPVLALDAAAGFPIDFSQRGSLSTDARFYETGLSVTDLWHTTGRIYAVQVLSNDILDREAVGGNLQGVWGRVGVSGNVDYDTQFGDFNDRFVSLDYAIRESVHLTIGRDVRKDPYLRMSTALQDQAAIAAGLTTLGDLVTSLGEPAVRDLARSSTIDTTDTRAGVRWTISPQWSTSADYSHGVSRVPEVGGGRTERTFDRASWYIAQYNAWRFPDTASALVIHQHGFDLVSDTFALNAAERVSAWATLQFRGRVEYANFKNGGTTDAIRYVPGLVLNLDPASFMTVTLEGEYTFEDRFYEPGRTAVFSRLNVTVMF